MILLKVISRLLDYPSADLFKARDEMIEIVNQSQKITADNKTQFVSFIQELTARDLYDAQESYDLLFDRGRALSLLLFEHVHGESRDRGQAMVNLINVYRSKGFEVGSSQLPDYIPLYLEFLSEQPSEFAIEWLGDICHLMTMLSERLIDRECYYSILFDSLIDLSGLTVNREEVAKSVKKEQRDDTIEAIDREWEDKEIKFDDPIPAGNQCSGSSSPSFDPVIFDPTEVHQSSQILDKNNIQQVPIKWHTNDVSKSLDAAKVSGL